MAKSAMDPSVFPYCNISFVSVYSVELGAYSTMNNKKSPCVI
eukprot:CAMPEP_0197055906 /NCGR_PEP_ID=MMETSP1384-20130603/75375_1 /TAXON_ID=29189 /ORGANISM="Ammonia sp." /LENGTH=41 /DNA_ID= /DNA_START= /DNA_END= /DNA_ORIENTATION=